MIGAIPGVLERARVHTEPALRDAVRRLHPSLRAPVHYHLGWADAEGNPVAAGGGKGVRPALALLSAEAAGGAAEVGVPGAIAVELVHNFSLLHDDVIDGDRERRHRPTVWALFSVGEAVIAGDSLLALALEVLLESASPGAPQAAMALVQGTQSMIAGQALDMAFEARLDVSVDECLEMELGKTGALLACAAGIGARLADGPDSLVEGLATFGRHLGLAFQAVDDLLGIWGRPEVTGKPAWSDLRERKKSLPVVLALAGRGPGAHELRTLFTNGRLEERDVARAADLVEACGGRDGTEQAAERHLEAALDALASAQPARGAEAELVELARFVTRREF